MGGFGVKGASIEGGVQGPCVKEEREAFSGRVRASV
jgi:hypothetical protein